MGARGFCFLKFAFRFIIKKNRFFLGGKPSRDDNVPENARKLFMLKISGEQMAAFRKMRVEAFKKGVLAHIESFFPEHWKAIGENQLRRVVELAMERSKRHGLETEREIYLFLSMMLYLGSYFDEDPMFYEIAKFLKDESIPSPGERAEKAFDETLAWADRVFGTRDENLKEALKRILDGIPSRLVPEKKGWDHNDIKPLLMFVFPEKLREIPENRREQMVEKALEKARLHGFENDDELSLAVAGAFMLGAGFDNDPQFPWIRRNVENSEEGRKRMKPLVEEMFSQIELWLS
jgi:hypothetical protein